MLNKKTKTTIREVAEQAGVSTALVSIVMNAKKRDDGTYDCPVKQSTAEHVLKVAAEMNYQPNRAAASLRSGNMHTIAIIVPSISGSFFSHLCRCIENIAFKAGYAVIFGSSDDNADKLGNIIKSFVSYGVDGLFIVPCEGSTENIRSAVSTGVPVILLTRDIQELDGVGRIQLDDEGAIRTALKHLYDNGYRNIEMISSLSGYSTLRARENAYRKVMEELGLGSFIREKMVDMSNMEASVERLLEEAVNNHVEAVLHPSATLCKLSFAAIHKLGLKVPDNMAIIGFDGPEEYKYFVPSITQIKQPVDNTAEVAMDVMLNMIKDGKPRTAIVSPLFVEGGSTACVYPERIANPVPVWDISKLNTNNSVLLPASMFSDKGGWTLDQQFMQQCGSSFLLAHGLGKPVEDATTMFEIPSDGLYNVFVRTRNWTSRWSDAPTPGVFRLLLDGSLLSETLGTGKRQWHWQSVGKQFLNKGTHKVGVHDLSGFDARIDSVLLTKTDSVPPDDADAARVLRKTLLGQPKNKVVEKEYDFVVAGGGVAGMCAAIAAARKGLSVALIQDRMVLGGNNSSEVRVGLGGRLNIGKYPSLGYLMNEFGPATKGNARPYEVYEDEKKMKIVQNEKNIKLYLGYKVTSVNCEDGMIKSVTATDVRKYNEITIKGRLFSDCTGDATLGVLAGADWTMGREAFDKYAEPSAPVTPDGITLGASMQWYSEEKSTPQTFPDIDWGLQLDETTAQKVRRGQWYWEVGMKDDQIEDAEMIRDYGMYVAYSNWSYLKNRAPYKEEYANSKLEWLCSVIGKRESRRLLGPVVLTENDLTGFVNFPDGSASTSWYIDNHEPDPENAARFKEPWLSRGVLRPLDFYPLPFRCFYSRNISNLFMAGRNISVSHLALGTTRVMRTCAMIGEVVGLAASLCVKTLDGIDRTKPLQPSDIFPAHWSEMDALMKKGAGRTDVPYLQVYTLVDTTGARSEDC